MTRNSALALFRAALENTDVLVPDVSKWSVGMHVQHCCLTMAGICKTLARSQPPPPRDGFSLPRLVVLTTGRIPRGRGRAPEVVLPKDDVTREELAKLLSISEQLLTRSADLHRDAWFKHPVFGVLKRDKTLRFIDIHNRHHLRIIADIVAA